MPIEYLQPFVAKDEAATDYDRRLLLIYAELLDAYDAGIGWCDGARDILGIDPSGDPDAARRCWDSHLVRARWIIGDGLEQAVEAFGAQARSAVDRQG